MVTRLCSLKAGSVVQGKGTGRQHHFLTGPLRAGVWSTMFTAHRLYAFAMVVKP